jgi:hypothetical protein
VEIAIRPLPGKGGNQREKRWAEEPLRFLCVVQADFDRETIERDEALGEPIGKLDKSNVCKHFPCRQRLKMAKMKKRFADF